MRNRSGRARRGPAGVSYHETQAVLAFTVFPSGLLALVATEVAAGAALRRNSCLLLASGA